SEATKSLADSFGADFIEIKGDDLLKQNYPLIYTVGKASVDEPRLLKLRWGDDSNPLLGLVGKGVCFDSGGLDLKSAAGMRWMKKDMGGAAHVLGLASFIMANKLPVCLEVLIPAVENAVSGNAFRPGDVIVARNGKSVEIDNTDAEGRLVMADALAELSEKKPDLLIDFATLTGAARVAVGTEVAAFFSNNDTTSHNLYKAAKRVEDDIWRLPIHHAYFDHIKSTIADVVNCSSGGYGGAITAALFLNEFVEKKCDWLHFDMMAYNMRSRPGRPKGGEAMGLRGVCEFLTARYSN
ncbi:MAG: leucyl aminopeptidase family protein, partial [Pseudomonadota bacterium]